MTDPAPSLQSSPTHLCDDVEWFAALFNIGMLVMVLANVLGRMFNFNPSRSDA